MEPMFQSSTGLSSNVVSDFSQISDHPIEQADWLDVNQKLRQSGYDPIFLSHPNKLNGTSSGFIILEEMVAFGLRNTLETLLGDCERKQDLMQELVTSSNKLQRELDEERSKQDERKKEILSLQASLEAEKIKFQEMEMLRASELENHSEQIQKLAAANSKIHTQNRELEQKNVEILSKLQDLGVLERTAEEKPESGNLDNEAFTRENEGTQRERTQARKSKNAETFHQYDKKLTEMQQELEKLRLKVSKKESRNSKPRKNPDRKSDKIDSKINTVQQDEATSVSDRFSDFDDYDDMRSETTMVSDSVSFASTMSSEISDAGFLYKRLKTTERKFKEAKKLIKELSQQNGRLTAEIKTRPKLKEWRKTLVVKKQMENVLRENNLSPAISSGSTAAENTIKKCTHVDGIDFLPIDVCREHLKDVCSRMDVRNINDISRKLETLEDSFQLNYKMEKVLRHLLRTVKSHEDRDDASIYSGSLNEEARSDEIQWKCLVPTIKVWRDELKQLTVLSDMVKRLSEMLLPWKNKDQKNPEKQQPPSIKITASDLQNQLSLLEEECKRGPVKNRRGPPNKDELLHVVQHFMKLYDVEDISGTFARMNDVYVKYSEMANVLHTVKDLVGLEKNANAANIVNSIGTLAKAKHLLHMEDLDNVINRLDQYDEFYLAFKSVISSLLEILGVDAVEEIVPAVRALVRFP